MNHRLAAFSAALLIGGVACSTNVEEVVVPAPAGGAGTDGGAQKPPPGATSDAGTDAGGTFSFKAAPAGTWPTAKSYGGSVVKSGKIVPILYAGDPQAADIEAFIAKLGTTPYWSAITAEYGVGALTAKKPIVLDETAPTDFDDDQVTGWFTKKFSNDPSTFGAPDPNTLYVIYFPSGTKVTQASGTSCTDFGGYHYETSIGGTTISYAILPRCEAFANLAGTDVTTFAASHEILEWATDPHPQTDRAWATVDDDHLVWSRVFLGELADLCTQLGDVSFVPAELGFRVQRTWSNASAAAGHHPCVPLNDAIYFTAFPTKLDPLTVKDELGQTVTTRGLHVGVGESKTIDLMLYSDAALASWKLQVIDITKIYGKPAEFSYVLDRSSGTAGDVVKLTITGVSPANRGQGFIIVSQTNTAANLYPVWVMN